MKLLAAVQRARHLTLLPKGDDGTPHFQDLAVGWDSKRRLTCAAENGVFLLVT